MALLSDEFLLSAFARGDRDAFDRLTARYSGVLDSYFRRRLPDDGRVEELRQETLLALYALLQGLRFRPPDEIRRPGFDCSAGCRDVARGRVASVRRGVNCGPSPSLP